MFYERLEELCAEKGVKAVALLTGLGFSKGNLQKWRTGIKPGSRILQRLSGYFNVSVDYLLGKSGEKDEIVCLYNAMTEKEKNELIVYARGVIEGRKL